MHAPLSKHVQNLLLLGLCHAAHAARVLPLSNEFGSAHALNHVQGRNNVFDALAVVGEDEHTGALPAIAFACFHMLAHEPHSVCHLGVRRPILHRPPKHVHELSEEQIFRQVLHVLRGLPSLVLLQRAVQLTSAVRAVLFDRRRPSECAMEYLYQEGCCRLAPAAPPALLELLHGLPYACASHLGHRVDEVQPLRPQARERFARHFVQDLVQLCEALISRHHKQLDLAVMRVLRDVWIIVEAALYLADHAVVDHALDFPAVVPRRRCERDDARLDVRFAQRLHHIDEGILATCVVRLVHNHAHHSLLRARCVHDVLLHTLRRRKHHALRLPERTALCAGPARSGHLHHMRRIEADGCLDRPHLLVDQRLRGGQEDNDALRIPTVEVGHHHASDERLAQARRKADHRVLEERRCDHLELILTTRGIRGVLPRLDLNWIWFGPILAVRLAPVDTRLTP